MALLAIPSQAQADITEKINQALSLVNAGNAEQAYLLLLEHEEEFAGSRDYDYALGLSALESGRVAKAIFSLQRVIAVDPKFSGARMELARAYMAIREFTQAEREFQILEAQEPPRTVRDVIYKYRLIISAAARKPTLSYSTYLESLMGYDSNANNATDESQVFETAVSPGFTLDERSRQIESPYAQVSTGGQIFYPLGTSTALLAGLNLRVRENIEASFLDTATVDGALAIRKLFSSSFIQLLADGGRIDVDGRENSMRNGFSGEWRSVFSRQHTAAFGGRMGQVRYDEAVNSRDVDQIIYYAQYIYQFSATGHSTIGATLSRGEDFAPGYNANNIYDRTINIFGIQGRWSLDSALNLDYSLTLSQFDYMKSPPPSGLGARTDQKIDLMIGLQWKLSDSLHLNTFLRGSDQVSEVDIYDYSKVDFGLGLRWSFPSQSTD